MMRCGWMITTSGRAPTHAPVDGSVDGMEWLFVGSLAARMHRSRQIFIKHQMWNMRANLRWIAEARALSCHAHLQSFFFALFHCGTNDVAGGLVCLLGRRAIRNSFKCQRRHSNAMANLGESFDLERCLANFDYNDNFAGILFLKCVLCVHTYKRWPDAMGAGVRHVAYRGFLFCTSTQPLHVQIMQHRRRQQISHILFLSPSPSLDLFTLLHTHIITNHLHSFV